MKRIPDTPQAGAAIMAIAMLVVPVMDMFAKLLTETMSPGAIGLARLSAQSVILLPFVLMSQQWGRPTWMHLLAGCFLGAALVSLNAALKHMPIANAIAIFFVEPLILTLMSFFILGEQLGWRRFLAVAAGLVGAMIVIRPNWDAFGPAAIYPLISAICYASYMLITRVVTQKGGRLALQFWISVFATLALSVANAVGNQLGAPALVLGWPGTYELFLIAGMGMLAALTHWMIAHALARAAAGTLAPLQYLEIISATLIGWLVFADFPDPVTWLGAAIIVGAGIYVFYRERQLARQPA